MTPADWALLELAIALWRAGRRLEAEEHVRRVTHPDELRRDHLADLALLQASTLEDPDARAYLWDLPDCEN